MNGQEHRVDLGEKGEILMIVENPVIKFWRKADVLIDLSKCADEYRRLALKELPIIAIEKLKGREFHLHIEFPHFSS